VQTAVDPNNHTIPPPLPVTAGRLSATFAR